MKTSEEVDWFIASIREPLEFDRESISLQARVFESCIPSSFLKTEDKDVKHNRAVWEKIVLKYCGQLPKALEGGASLLFVGDNGTGKTMFACYILMEALKLGYSGYYITALDLDFYFRRGMVEHGLLEQLDRALSSDFLVLDELGAEVFKTNQDSFTRVQVDRILKRRYDNSLPTILASNANVKQLSATYGMSIRSLLTGGKYLSVVFEPGDYRVHLQTFFSKLGIKK
jgi:DNA replication protein DnaC